MNPEQYKQALALTENKSLSAPSLILCSLMAVLCGLLAQQIVETTLNTYLTLLPFNLKTI